MLRMLRITGLLVLITVSVGSADIITSVRFNSGYSNNIFADSVKTNDVHNTISGKLAVYPNSFTELSLSAGYTHYYQVRDLSNLDGSVSLTLIPTPETSPFTLTAHGAVSKRAFGTVFELYDTEQLQANLTAQYQLAPNASIRSTAYYTNTDYPNSDNVSDRYAGVSGGLNITLLQNNSFDIETIFYRKTYSAAYLDNIPNESNEFDFIDYKLRYSRPIGQRIGLNLTYRYHNLQSHNNFTITGYSIDYLSPWSSLWNGHALSAGMKYIMKSLIIMELSGQYADKQYVSTYETDPVGNGNNYTLNTRADQYSELSVKFSKTVLTETMICKPSVIVSYINNSSTNSLYDYDAVGLMFVASISF